VMYRAWHAGHSVGGLRSVTVAAADHLTVSER
jgi:hypothetical protein